VQLAQRLVEPSARALHGGFRLVLLAQQRLDLLLQLGDARAERDDDARDVLLLALDGVDVARRGLHVDASLRGDLGDLLERHAQRGELLLVGADLFLAIALRLLEPPQLVDGRVPARQELVLFLGVERLLFAGHGEVALEAVELHRGTLALAATLAQLLLRRARPFLGEHAGVVGDVQLFLDEVQLLGDAAGARLFVAEERFEIAELPLEREDTGDRPLRLPADEQRPRGRCRRRADERRARPLLGAVDRFADGADDVGSGMAARTALATALSPTTAYAALPRRVMWDGFSTRPPPKAAASPPTTG